MICLIIELQKYSNNDIYKEIFQFQDALKQ